MEQNCFSPGCKKPVEFSCSCVNPNIFLCDIHLSWHISTRKKDGHPAKRIDSKAEVQNKDCSLCLRSTSKYLCLCRGLGIKLCNDCYELHSIQSSGNHTKDSIEALEFIKDERDLILYIQRRDQIDNILKVIKDNSKDIQAKEEMLKILNTKLLEHIKKWYEDSISKISQAKKAVQRLANEIGSFKFKKDITNQWIFNYLQEKDVNKVFKTVKIDIHDDNIDPMLKNLFIIELDSLLSKVADIKPEQTVFITEKDSNSLYQRVQSMYLDNRSSMIPKIEVLYNKVLEPSKIESIQQVELSNCMLGANGCKYLSAVLPALSNLKYLNISSNNIGSSGAKELGPGISQVKQLATLLISWNKIQNKGLESISEAISELPHLKILQLSWNEITEAGAQYLARSLPQCECLEKLELWNNPLGPEGIRSLVLTLPYLTKLKTLDLNKTNTGPEGAEVLSIVLPKLTELTNLCIANNNITSSGVIAISKQFGNNKKLQVIELSRNSIDTAGVQSLLDIMAKLPRGTNVLLTDNLFDREDRIKIRNTASMLGLRIN